jgi:hypothetical protein
VSEPTLGCFITSHGFGHASRSLAVLTELQALVPALRFEVFTQTPYWFLAENLDPACFTHHDVNVDVGLVQKNPFQHDLPATLERLKDFLPLSKSTIDPLVTTLSHSSCRAIFCDISALGIAVANAIGIPSILLENFTWDWMYEEYLDEMPAFSDSIECIRSVYAQANLHLQTEPVCNPITGALTIPPISRRFRVSRETTRSSLDVLPEEHLVLLTTGGIRGSYDMLDRLRERSEVRFLLSGSSDTLQNEANLIHLPHRSGYHHPDLVGASDALVGKAGYGTVAEVRSAGSPFARVLRDNFRESPVLGAYLDKHILGFTLSDSQFNCGSWIDRLDELLSQPRNDNGNDNGASLAAAHIVPFLQ